MSGIIWLASYPKSGNTWLRAFLANLLENGSRPVAINDLPRYAFGDNNLLHYRDLTGRDPASLTSAEIAALRPRIHEWFARSQEREVFVKTHNAMLRVEGEPLITPSATAGAIYVVRNPFDLAVSFSHHYRLPLQKAVDGLCDEKFMLLAADNHASQYLGSWATHVRSWQNAPGLTQHRLRFEDMVCAPTETFGAVAQFLGFPPDPERLRKAIAFSRFEELAGQEQAGGFVEARSDDLAFFRQGRIGVWRDVLSDPQVRQLIDALGPVLVELGYATDAGRLTIAGAGDEAGPDSATADFGPASPGPDSPGPAS